MNERALKSLEFDKIRAQCATHTASDIGREFVDALVPTDDLERAEMLLRQTWEADGICRRIGGSPIDTFPDARITLQRVRAAYALSPLELLNLAACLKASRRARERLLAGEEESELHRLANPLSSHAEIENEIGRCILTEDEISDNASPELSRIRRQMRITAERVKEKLNNIIKSPTYQKYLQEPIVTVRNGRYAIPVKAEHRAQIGGLIHDQSGSGQTVFIEPAAVVELGNAYKQLQAEEKREIERILAGLTALIAPYADELYQSLMLLGNLDCIFARAILARDMRAYCPKLNDKSLIHIKNGRHPLIDPKTVVPISVWIGDGYDTLIVTGPNTGGKTVTLKTVGLFTLMASSGMFLPADESSEIAVFREVFADIGDEQSIEQSLSTFSAHMTNLVGILKEAGSDTLVLLDELGAGTDPNEGAALAQAILKHLQEAGATTFATTHYSEIKAFALTHEGMQNASMEFDVDRLCPTYKLYIGIPGKSNAFEISRRLGLDDSIIEQAKEYLKHEDVAFEDVLSGAEAQRKLAEQQASELTEELEKARRERIALETERNKLKEDRAAIREKAREEARSFVAATKHEMDALIAELRQVKNIDTKALERAIQTSRDKLRESSNRLSDTVETASAEGETPKSVVRGQTVRVVSLNNTATVLKPQDAKGQVQVQAGLIKVFVPLSDLRTIERKQEKPREKTRPREIMTDIKTVKYELDLRGFLVDDAILEIDAFIDDCIRTGRTEFNIIHGKGTGALRAGVQNYLKTHPRVKSFRIGAYGEGDAGVTVVTLKS
ncbi:MAG: endonuclease MutS2 [Clostridia bacterium]|nr:endonuclease MutS2 [Clostridia bacterium]